MIRTLGFTFALVLALQTSFAYVANNRAIMLVPTKRTGALSPLFGRSSSALSAFAFSSKKKSYAPSSGYLRQKNKNKGIGGILMGITNAGLPWMI